MDSWRRPRVPQLPEALAEEARARPHLEIAGDARPLPFDAAGNLEQEKLFPHSVRGRRQKHA